MGTWGIQSRRGRGVERNRGTRRLDSRPDPGDGLPSDLLDLGLLFGGPHRCAELRKRCFRRCCWWCCCCCCCWWWWWFRRVSVNDKRACQQGWWIRLGRRGHEMWRGWEEGQGLTRIPGGGWMESKSGFTPSIAVVHHQVHQTHQHNATQINQQQSESTPGVY